MRAPTDNSGMLGGRHLATLDGVRGMAALMIFTFHLIQASPSQWWLPSILGRVASLGQSGVDLFFVLSGLLITGILLDNKDAASPVRTFHYRRALRIFPLYYASLAIFFIALPLVGLARWQDLRSVGWYLVYAQNVPPTFGWQMAGPGHFWFLAVQEHFYLLWPLVVTRLTTGGVVRVAVGLIAASTVCRVAFVSLGWSTFFFTPCRLDGLAAGALLAVAIRRPAASSRVSRLGPWVYGVLAIAFLPLYLAMSGAGLAWVQVVKPIMWTALYAGFLAALVSAAPRSRLARVLSLRPLCLTGKYSYSFYVFHPAIIAGAIGMFGSSELLACGAALGGTCAVAMLSWHFVERPCLTLKSRMPFGKPRVEAGRRGTRGIDNEKTAVDAGLESSVMPDSAAE